jgi:crossover junction endodeoxyribonuclease RuvC
VKPSVILGLDPGTHRLGYAVLKAQSPLKFQLIDYGTKEVPPKTHTLESLVYIRKVIQELIDKYKPELVSVEELFFNKNLKTAAKVYQARGVILLTLAERNLRLIEPTATQIKKGIAGNGRATKQQIKRALQLILGLNKLDGQDDSWDAIAAAFVGYGMC